MRGQVYSFEKVFALGIGVFWLRHSHATKKRLGGLGWSFEGFCWPRFCSVHALVHIAAVEGGTAGADCANYFILLLLVGRVSTVSATLRP